MTRILVIRLGALGDFVLSFAPFAAIRAHHPGTQVVLLTTAPYAELAARAPWFDAVLIDHRPAWWNFAGLLRLRRQLRGFDLVYDLQTSARSSGYFRLAGRPAWSGIAPGCSLPHANRARDFMHTLERQREQLAIAGISEFPAPDLAWLRDASCPSDLPRRFAVLVPGAAAHRDRKRWPAECFGELARALVPRGLIPVVLGVSREKPLAHAICTICPEALDLTDRTTLLDLAAIVSRAELAIGNDTGPMHLATALGCRSIVLFSSASDPALTAPRGPAGSWPAVIRVDDLRTLTVERVLGMAETAAR